VKQLQGRIERHTVQGRSATRVIFPAYFEPEYNG
jgi:hypothetical protein